MTTPEQILAAVEEATGAKASEILTDKRTAHVATSRFLAMLLYAETHPWNSNQDAAMAVGKLDPGTGRHGLMRARHLLQHDPDFRVAYDRARKSLGIQPVAAG
jgi:chromosomal replication initiation ATPase DnaA